MTNRTFFYFLVVIFALIISIEFLKLINNNNLFINIFLFLFFISNSIFKILKITNIKNEIEIYNKEKEIKKQIELNVNSENEIDYVNLKNKSIFYLIIFSFFSIYFLMNIIIYIF